MSEIDIELKDHISRYGQAPWRYLPKHRKEHAPVGTKLYMPSVGDDFNFGIRHRLHTGKRLSFFVQQGVVTENTHKSSEDGVIVQMIEVAGYTQVPDDGNWFYEEWQAISEGAKIVLDKKEWITNQADELLCEANKKFKKWKEGEDARSK